MVNTALAQELAGGVHALAIHASAPGDRVSAIPKACPGTDPGGNRFGDHEQPDENSDGGPRPAARFHSLFRRRSALMERTIDD